MNLIVETFPATKRERGTLRYKEDEELTDGGGNRDRQKTGGNRVTETSRSGTGVAKGTREAMGTKGNVRGLRTIVNVRSYGNVRERERERPRERQATVMEIGPKLRTEGVGRPYL